MKPLQETSNCDPYPCRTLCRSSLKTKTLSTKKKGPWMQAPNRGLTESSGEVFLLDTLSHRMSEMGDVYANDSRRSQSLVDIFGVDGRVFARKVGMITC